MFPKLKQINQFCSKQPPEKKNKHPTSNRYNSKSYFTNSTKTCHLLSLYIPSFSNRVCEISWGTCERRKIFAPQISSMKLQKGWMNQAERKLTPPLVGNSLESFP